MAALFAQSAEAGGPISRLPKRRGYAPRPADFIRDRPARDARAVRGPLPTFRLSVVGGVGNARRCNPELQPQGLPAALRQRKNEDRGWYSCLPRMHRSNGSPAWETPEWSFTA